jgi:hypothetical protein
MMIGVKLYGARNINSISMVEPKKIGNHRPKARRELPCWGFHNTDRAVYRAVPLGRQPTPPGGGGLSEG